METEYLRKKLKHTNFDGIIHYGTNGEEKINLTNLLKEFRKQLRLKEVDVKTKQLKDFCNHLNTHKGLEEIRFDFMLVDFLQKSNFKINVAKLCKNCGNIMDEASIAETELCSGCFTMNA